MEMRPAELNIPSEQSCIILTLMASGCRQNETWCRIGLSLRRNIDKK